MNPTEESYNETLKITISEFMYIHRFSKTLHTLSQQAAPGSHPSMLLEPIAKVETDPERSFLSFFLCFAQFQFDSSTECGPLVAQLPCKNCQLQVL